MFGHHAVRITSRILNFTNYCGTASLRNGSAMPMRGQAIVQEVFCLGGGQQAKTLLLNVLRSSRST
jgi:hypothetical protein